MFQTGLPIPHVKVDTRPNAGASPLPLNPAAAASTPSTTDSFGTAAPPAGLPKHAESEEGNGGSWEKGRFGAAEEKGVLVVPFKPENSGKLSEGPMKIRTGTGHPSWRKTPGAAQDDMLASISNMKVSSMRSGGTGQTALPEKLRPEYSENMQQRLTQMLFSLESWLLLNDPST